MGNWFGLMDVRSWPRSSHWTSFITPVATLTDTFVYTLQATGVGATGVGNAASPRYVSITPAGPVAKFPQAVSVP